MKTKIFLFLVLVWLWAGCTGNDPYLGEGVRLQMKAVSGLGSMNARLADGQARLTHGPEGSDSTDLVFNEVLLGVREIEFEPKDEDDDSEGHDGDRSGHDGDGSGGEGSGDDDDDGDGNEGEGGGDDDGEGDDDDGDGEGDDDDNEGNEEIEFEGAFVVDLIAGTSTPDFGIADVPPGLYEEIEIELAPILPDSNSVFIAFTVTNADSSTVQVEISTKKKIEIEIEKDGGFQVDDNVLNSIVVLLDLDKLLSGIDLSQAEADENGIIKINDSSNAELIWRVLSNLKNSCHAGEDSDD